MDILTNRVDVQLNYASIDRDFDVIQITTDLTEKKHYGKVVNTIYKNVKPLSLCYLERNRMACLLKKGAKYSLNDEHFSVKAIESSDITKSANVKLLTGALPSFISDRPYSSEGVGLYYLANIETIKCVQVLRTFEFKFQWEQKKDLVLQVQSATFTPVSYHTNKEGELYKDCRHLPQITFDQWSQQIDRARSGSFIKKKHRDKRMSAEMLTWDSRNPGKFWNSKVGVLSMFMEDIKRYLSDYLSIEFLRLSPKYRVKFKDRDIKAQYAQIDQILSEHKLNLINLTDEDMSPLIEQLEVDGVEVRQSSSVCKDALNLAIHHEKDFYEAHQLEDPYHKLRKDRDVVIQSAYPGTLLKSGNLLLTQYQACKKELLVKLETVNKHLKLIKPSGNWMCATCNQVDDLTLYQTVSCHEGKLSFKIFDEALAEKSFLLDLPRPMKNGEHTVIDLDTEATYLFEETQQVALPEFEKLAVVANELTKGFDQGIERQWIDEFLVLLHGQLIEASNPELVEQRLQKLLEHNQNTQTFFKEDLFGQKDTKISYQGSMQIFFDWIASEKGLRLGASLKSEQAGLIESSLGLFYNEEEKLYFVGDQNNVKTLPRFCRIRRILTDEEAVPEALLKMMEAFHIRHKQATVLPFLFKHLRERIMLGL